MLNSQKNILMGLSFSQGLTILSLHVCSRTQTRFVGVYGLYNGLKKKSWYVDHSRIDLRGHDLRHKDKRNFYLSKLPRNRLSETAMISSLKVHYKYFYSGSPGLVSNPGRQLLDGHFSHLFIVRIVMFV